jgi:glucan phosphoethanolaminetransferase (alkaline phosphatase superfamily)
MFKNKRPGDDDSIWDVMNSKVKSWAFTIVHELLEMQLSSVLFYNLLYIIETIQLLYYSIHPNTKHMWTAKAFTGVRDVLKMFQIDSALEKGAFSTNLSLLLVFVILTIIIVIMMPIIIYKISSSKRKSSVFLTYSLKILSFIVLLQITVLNMPALQALIAP